MNDKEDQSKPKVTDPYLRRFVAQLAIGLVGACIIALVLIVPNLIVSAATPEKVLGSLALLPVTVGAGMLTRVCFAQGLKAAHEEDAFSQVWLGAILSLAILGGAGLLWFFIVSGIFLE